jgi:hypothetical protein
MPNAKAQSSNQCQGPNLKKPVWFVIWALDLI